MDGLGAMLERRVDDAVDAEVTFRGGGGPHMLGFIRHAHVQRGAVGIRIDGHGSDLHFPERAHHPNRDLAAVGNQDLTKHSVRL